MFSKKPPQIDVQLAPPNTALAEPVPSVFQTMPTPAGALITRDQFARVPVPEGFDTTNLTAINKGRTSQSST